MFVPSELQNALGTYSDSGSSPSPSGISASQSPSQCQSPAYNEEDYLYTSSSPQSSEGSGKTKPPRIALDPSQPPTIRGTPRERVYVACHECRARRVRCDGAKPACFNCRRRNPHVESFSCTYDVAPKRRGIDKVPGSRTRARNSAKASPQPRFEDILHGFDPSKFNADAVDSYRLPSPPPVDAEEQNGEPEQMPVDTGPAVQFTKDTWWDALLALYANGCVDPKPNTLDLTTDRRVASTKQVLADVRLGLRVSVYWASFIHPLRLLESMSDPSRRHTIQPSLVFSMLAVTELVRGSELKEGAASRIRALKLVEHAHCSLQASLNSNWVDIGLVQAAWFIAYFEMQSHPDQSLARRRSALVLLDSLIRLLSLTSLDADHPQSRYSIFGTYSDMYPGQARPPGAVDGESWSRASAQTSPATTSTTATGCSCDKFMLWKQWPAIAEVAPTWGVITMWPSKMGEGEMRKEEFRRMVWSSLMLTAGHHCSTSMMGDTLDLYIGDHASYSLLFPGDTLCRAGLAPVPRDNVWNLCLRAMLLWHAAIRCRNNQKLGAQERTQFATGAWLEADAIEATLGRHSCDTFGVITWQTRACLSMIRMCASHEFSRFAPEITTNGTWELYRGKIQTWLHELIAAGESVSGQLQDDEARRPILLCWFTGHMIRALGLYEADNTLLLALDAAKKLVAPMELLMRLWPCKEERDKWQRHRYQLVKYCQQAGVEPPATSLPLPLPLLASNPAASVSG
ncbi:hypothetical protein C8Q80DRAFT_1195731 [Daedaleopsis nitida]|nr:hypothetical protein C8Q80DRAFT_1195731 [Daedaleopsis nitida]